MSNTFDIFNFSSYKITHIDAKCDYSVPCVHEVSILFLNKIIKANISGDLIAKYLKHHNMIIPYHYDIYISERAMLN